MKGQNTITQNALVNKAFDEINSAVGVELNEIVDTIEHYSNKQKKSNTPAKVIALVKTRAKRIFALAK